VRGRFAPGLPALRGTVRLLRTGAERLPTPQGLLTGLHRRLGALDVRPDLVQRAPRLARVALDEAGHLRLVGDLLEVADRTAALAAGDVGLVGQRLGDDPVLGHLVDAVADLHRVEARVDERGGPVDVDRGVADAFGERGERRHARGGHGDPAVLGEVVVVRDHPDGRGLLRGVVEVQPQVLPLAAPVARAQHRLGADDLEALRRLPAELQPHLRGLAAGGVGRHDDLVALLALAEAEPVGAQLAGRVGDLVVAAPHRHRLGREAVRRIGEGVAVAERTVVEARLRRTVVLLRPRQLLGPVAVLLLFLLHRGRALLRRREALQHARDRVAFDHHVVAETAAGAGEVFDVGLAE